MLALTATLNGGAAYAAPASATGQSARTDECQGDWLPNTPTSDEIMKGRLSFLGLDPVKVGKNVDWHMNPYHNRSWAMVFHSLRWMGRLVADYETTGDRAMLTRATEIAKDWVHDNPRGGRTTSPYAWAEHPIALRAPALVCLSMHVKADWLTKSLVEHARMLSNPALYEKGHNHGMDQDIALLRIGCRYGHKEWTGLAVRRLTNSVKLDIDAQGALQEQAPRYGLYVHERLAVAMHDIRDCGLKVPSEITRRWRLLEGYITQATQPNGYMVPIGDGAADVRPSGFTPSETKTVRVYRAGYVFGRTTWGGRNATADDDKADDKAGDEKADDTTGDQAGDADDTAPGRAGDAAGSAFYSIRFGPALKFHGHEDHLGVTYYAQGRDVLVEAGFVSYENTPYRRWTMTPEAHNVPIVQGARFRGRTATALTASAIHADRQSFKLTDKAYGVPRTRSVLVNHGEDVMAVLDTVPKGSTVRDLWHFAAGLKVLSNHGGTVVVGEDTRGRAKAGKDDDTGGGAWRASLGQLAMPACRPIGGQTVKVGRTSPFQGWVSPAYLKKEAAPAVVSPAARSLLTVIVPGTGSPDVSCSGGKVTVHAASGGTVTFRASASGSLS
jgi:hypothetical protein